MMKIFALTFSICLSLSLSAQSDVVYVKEYFGNKKLKAEGWMVNGVKVKYWKYYNPYGVLKAEGHYEDGEKAKYWFFYRANGEKLKEGTFTKGAMDSWWAFYDNSGVLIERCQFKLGKRNGYRVVYLKAEPVKVEKFEKDTKTDQWTSYSSFVKDNGFPLNIDE